MYPRDFMGKKLEKLSIFSVVTEISTNGDILKDRASTFWTHFSDRKIHVDYEYIIEIARIDDNRRVLVDFLEKSTLKNEIFDRKKLI